ncbi:unnamed protein product [Meloidogyne enterolobii]|uniref:Uncharacterized protein n=1 Tax=Meloidogyne enterolobii TaxID=390850 RepID=A0ACB1B3Q0_MELEN
MAISLTTTLLIISLALIAIIEGSGSGDASSSSSSPCKMGKLVNPTPSLLKHEHTTTNDEKKVNILKVASKTSDPIFKNTKIILEVGGIRCEASIKNTKGEECKIPSKEIKKGPQSGTLIFSYAEGKEVKVPFKDVHMFDDNTCNIVLEGYNTKTHELDFTLNGLYPLKVVPEDKKC